MTTAGLALNLLLGAAGIIVVLALAYVTWRPKAVKELRGTIEDLRSDIEWERKERARERAVAESSVAAMAAGHAKDMRALKDRIQYLEAGYMGSFVEASAAAIAAEIRDSLGPQIAEDVGQRLEDRIIQSVTALIRGDLHSDG